MSNSGNSQNKHLTIQLSTRQRQKLNQNSNNPCIIYPDEIEYSLRLGQHVSPEHGTEDSIVISVDEHHINRLNKGMVARVVTIEDNRISTLVLEPERVDQRT